MSFQIMKQSDDKRWVLFFLPLVVFFIIYSVNHFLDDTFIGLVYAENLRNLHFFTYDGVHPSYGASSPLYIFFNSLVLNISTSYYISKVISVLFYFMAIGFFYCYFVKGNNIFSILFFISLMAPVSVRWNTDGMETSWVLFLVITNVYFVLKYLLLNKKNNFTFWVLGLLALLGALTRIEFLFLNAFLFFGLFLQKLVDNRWKNVLGNIWVFIPSVIGFVLGFAIIYKVTGQLLPDTAIAKQRNPFQLGQINMFLTTPIKSLTVGLFSVFIYLVTAYLTIFKVNGKYRIFSVTINSLIFVLILLVYVTGMAVEGWRHIQWAFVVVIASNVFILNLTDYQFNLFKRVKPILISAVFVLIFTAEFIIIKPVFDLRSSMLAKIQKDVIELKLEGKRYLAYDFGFLSYFARGELVDYAGLVMGKDYAKLSTDERIKAISEIDFDFLYLREDQFRRFKNIVKDYDQFYPISELKEANVGSTNSHFIYFKRTSEK